MSLTVPDCELNLRLGEILNRIKRDKIEKRQFEYLIEYRNWDFLGKIIGRDSQLESIFRVNRFLDGDSEKT